MCIKRGVFLPLLLLITLASRNTYCQPASPSWQPIGLSGGGAMFAPAISPVDPDLMLINCDMSAAYLSEDGGHTWRMIHHEQLRSDTRCRPAFHPSNRDILFASSGGQLRVSRDRGKTFSPIGDLELSLQGEIAIHPDWPSLMLAGTSNERCSLSGDGGRTWRPCEGPYGRVLGFHFGRSRPDGSLFVGTQRGIWRSNDEGRTWEEKTSGLPWKEVQGFAGGSDPKSGAMVLYCTVTSKVENGAFRGGVYRSRNRGETWEPALGAGLNLETRTADEWAYGPISQYEQVFTTDANPLTVYVMNTSTGFHPPHSDTVYRSDDAGANWRPVYFMDPRFKAYNVAPDYVTASTGQSFKGGEAPFGAAICNSDPERLVLLRNEAHITHNGGKSWFCGSSSLAGPEKPGPGSDWVCSGLVVTTTWHHYIDPFDRRRQYIAYTDLGWARSVDAGKTWKWWDTKSWAPWRNTCYEIAFDPEIPGKLWGAFSDVHDIPNDNIISERHGHNRPGGVCLSEDFGASWHAVAKGLPAKAVTSVVVDPKSAKGSRVLFAGVFDAGVFKSDDDGRNWAAVNQGLGHPENMRVSRVFLHRDGSLFAMICARRPAAGQPLAGEGVGLYRSADSGHNWQKISQSHPFLYPKDFSVHAEDSRRILVGACDTGGEDRSGGLFRSQDGGVTWERIGRAGPQTFGGYFHPAKKDWIYMTLTEGAPGAGLWLSQDAGRTWRAQDDLPFANVQRVEFDPNDTETIYTTTFGGSVWRGPAAQRP
jgi:photosystem II stability/assembly factor-like uncharacterized protein